MVKVEDIANFRCLVKTIKAKGWFLDVRITVKN